MRNRNYDVMAWYFPNWHSDPRNDEWHGKGWTEWEVTKCARARFEGHDQPKLPLWGYADESNPNVMELKINTALEYGIDGFLWDTYWFEDGGYRMRALDEGFFGARNNEKFKIALMWCNHDPIYAHPATRRRPNDPLLSGELSADGFVRGSNHFIENYFWRPNYYRVDGRLLFVIWLPKKLIDGIGGVRQTRDVLDDFRSRVRTAGLGEVWLAAPVTAIPGVYNGDKAAADSFMESLGLDGTVCYSWPTDKTNFPTEPFSKFVDDGIKTFDRYNNATSYPFCPTVSNGWDSSPRTLQSEIYEDVGYPWSVVTTDRSPAEFERGLRAMRRFADSGDFRGKFVTLTTWNEWTEGNYLEPDVRFGYGFLEAVKRVFGN